MSAERYPVASDYDVIACRQMVRELADAVELSRADRALLTTAVSELARNIIDYAERGHLVIERIEREAREGIRVQAVDEGPGIANLELAMQDGFSTGGGLGLGLPGTRRIVDHFAIESEPGVGTHVTIEKWRR